MKFIVYNKLFSDEWGLKSALIGQNQFIRQLSRFINEKYPNINSFKELFLKTQKLCFGARSILGAKTSTMPKAKMPPKYLES